MKISKKIKLIIHNNTISTKQLEIKLKKIGFSKIQRLKISKIDSIKIDNNTIILSLIDYNNKKEVEEQFFLNYLTQKNKSILISFRSNSYGISIGPIVFSKTTCLNCVKEEIERFNSINPKSNTSKLVLYDIGKALILHLTTLAAKKNYSLIKNKMIHIYGDIPKIYYDFVFKKPFCEMCTNND
ncbi:MAG: hypothetical protein Q7S21_00070 [archaeon]|nr:hypothetical protein [archaeon]